MGQKANTSFLQSDEVNGPDAIAGSDESTEEEEGDDDNDDSDSDFLSFRVPDDILGLLLGHISSFAVFLNYFLLCKSFHYYVTSINPSCCSHIKFDVFEMPTTPKKYVRRIRILSRLSRVRPADRSETVDFVLRGKIIFRPELFPNLEELQVESAIAVIPRLLDPTEDDDSNRGVVDVLKNIRKIKLRAERRASVAMLVDEVDWDRIQARSLKIVVEYPCRTNGIRPFCRAVDEICAGNVWKLFSSLESLRIEGAGMISGRAILRVPLEFLRRFVFRTSEIGNMRTSRFSRSFERLYGAPLLQDLEVMSHLDEITIPFAWLLPKKEGSTGGNARNDTLRKLVVCSPSTVTFETWDLRMIPGLQVLELGSVAGVLRGLRRLSLLQTLKLRGNPSSLGSILPDLVHLEVFHLDGRLDGALERLAAAVSSASCSICLRELALESAQFSLESIAVLGDGLCSLSLIRVRFLDQIRPLELPRLVRLHIGACKSLVDSFLSRLSSLECLELCECPSISSRCLLNKPLLRQLQLYRCPSVSISASTDLPHFDSMRILSVSECDGIDGTILRRMPSLTSLNLGSSRLVGAPQFDDDDLVSFSALTRLQSLELNNSLVSDTLLQVFPTLRVLKLNQCSCVKGTGFSHLRHLQVLDVYCCDGIRSYRGLSKCRDLREFSVVSGVTPLPAVPRRVQRRLKVFKTH